MDKCWNNVPLKSKWKNGKMEKYKTQLIKTVGYGSIVPKFRKILIQQSSF